MRNIFYILLLVYPFQGYSENIAVNGKEYKIEIKESVLECSDFSIKSITKELPFSIRERHIPYEKTMGHKGNSHLINQSLSFAYKQNNQNIPAFYKQLSNYTRVDPNRPYLAKPIKCIENRSVLFYLWGGGNCSTVCEAYALVEFTSSGVISSLKGLNYKEYKKLKGN